MAYSQLRETEASSTIIKIFYNSRAVQLLRGCGWMPCGPHQQWLLWALSPMATHHANATPPPVLHCAPVLPLSPQHCCIMHLHAMHAPPRPLLHHALVGLASLSHGLQKCTLPPCHYCSVLSPPHCWYSISVAPPPSPSCTAHLPRCSPHPTVTLSILTSPGCMLCLAP